MTGRLNLTPRSEWQPATRDRTSETREHRCGLCFGPFGKSAIRCKNEPANAPQIAAERRTPADLNQLLAEIDDPKENQA